MIRWPDNVFYKTLNFGGRGLTAPVAALGRQLLSTL
jgi:hypothetical protein